MFREFGMGLVIVLLVNALCSPLLNYSHPSLVFLMNLLSVTFDSDDLIALTTDDPLVHSPSLLSKPEHPLNPAISGLISFQYVALYFYSDPAG
jgi:hypothetical protein